MAEIPETPPRRRPDPPSSPPDPPLPGPPSNPLTSPIPLHHLHINGTPYCEELILRTSSFPYEPCIIAPLLELLQAWDVEWAQNYAFAQANADCIAFGGDDPEGYNEGVKHLEDLKVARIAVEKCFLEVQSDGTKACHRKAELENRHPAR